MITLVAVPRWQSSAIIMRPGVAWRGGRLPWSRVKARVRDAGYRNSEELTKWHPLHLARHIQFKERIRAILEIPSHFVIVTAVRSFRLRTIGPVGAIKCLMACVDEGPLRKFSPQIPPFIEDRLDAARPFVRIPMGKDELASWKQQIELTEKQRYGKVGVALVLLKVARLIEDKVSLAIYIAHEPAARFFETFESQNIKRPSERACAGSVCPNSERLIDHC